MRKSSVDKINLSYPAPPEWVVGLAEACDQSSQNKIAIRLKRSSAALSQVLANKYPGDLKAFQRDVEDLLKDQKINCPALFDKKISLIDCRARQAQKISASNPLQIKQWRICKNCMNREEF